MGKRSRSSRMDGKVVSKDHSERPGWKGPGFQRPKEKPKPRPAAVVKVEEEEEVVESLIPLELQQLLLNIFKDVFAHTLGGNELLGNLQDVKTALYERDFEKAFGREEWREVYAVRWSPSRALCYQSILVDIQEYLDELSPSEQNTSSLRVACFGGGAAEVIAFGGLVKYVQDAASSSETEAEITTQPEGETEEAITTISTSLQTTSISPAPKLNLTLLDIADWTSVVSKLHTGLLTPPTISKYSSAAVKAANRPSLLTELDIDTTFKTEDVFFLTPKQMTESFGKEPMLLTLLFTLNELYSASIGKTTAFLLNLTAATKKGTLLLVVDSPGSYSETAVGSGGGEGKKYPMKWLLDHVMIGKQKKKAAEGEEVEEEEVKVEVEEEKDAAAWEKVVSDDSRWFRIPEGLKYPIPLENMRYQIHLYKRI